MGSKENQSSSWMTEKQRSRCMGGPVTMKNNRNTELVVIHRIITAKEQCMGTKQFKISPNCSRYLLQAPFFL